MMPDVSARWVLTALLCIVLVGEASARPARVRPEAVGPLGSTRPATVFVGGVRHPAPAPDAPRVLLIGDSNFFGPLGHTLLREFLLRGWNVKLRGKPSSGLARPEFFDWFAESQRLIDEVHPDLVVVMLGANDVQRITWPALGDRIQWKDEIPWRRAYEGRYREFATMLSQRVPEVVLLSPTNRGWDKARKAVTRVRELQQRAVRGLANVHWVDMFPLSSNADGSWLRFGPDPADPDNPHKHVVYRRGDRIHLTKAGGQLVGTRLIGTLGQIGLLAR